MGGSASCISESIVGSGSALKFAGARCPSQPVGSPPRDTRRPLKNGATPRHLTENRYSAGWYQPRQNASSQVLLSRMAEMIKPTIE
jgi:hypothetical protein